MHTPVSLSDSLMTLLARRTRNWKIPLTCALWLPVTLLLLGCQGNDNSKLKKLDQQRGIGSLVLGDSLYTQILESHRRKLTSVDETIETTIWGHVVNRGMDVELGERFLFGVERGNVTASALNGRIFAYTIWNSEIPQDRVRAIRDSLISKYGEPTHVLDSVYVTERYEHLPVLPDMSESEVLEIAVEKNILSEHAEIDSIRSTSSERWKGDSVSLELGTSGNGFALTIYEQKSVNDLLSARQSIDSVLTSNIVKPTKEIVKLPLLITKQNSLVTVEDSSSFSPAYSIPYEHIQPFFEIENKRRHGKFSSRRAVETSADFYSRLDSLTGLTVKFDKNIRGEDGAYDKPFVSIDYVSSKVESSVESSPALKKTKKTISGEFDILYWPGYPFGITVEESEAEVSVHFYKTKSVGFNSILGESSLTLPPSFYLPWPQR